MSRESRHLSFLSSSRDRIMLCSHQGLMFPFHIQIQFSYRISITSAALSVRFVAEEADMEKETVFHEFVSQNQQEFQWKRGIRSLPFNQSSGFHILFDVNGGMSRNVNKVVAAVTNISLSKECFAIGMRLKRSPPKLVIHFPCSLVFDHCLCRCCNRRTPTLASV